MLHIVLHPSAEKELARIPEKFQQHIREAIDELAQINHPLEHRHVIKLQGKRPKDFRMRVGDYRVRFTLQNNAIFITHIRHRKFGY